MNDTRPKSASGPSAGARHAETARDRQRFGHGPPSRAFCCPACQYDMWAGRSWVCSECGHTAEADDYVVWTRATNYVEDWPTLSLLGSLLAIIVFVTLEGCFTFGVGAIGALMALILVAPATAILPRHRRAAAGSYWINNVLLLHLPFPAGVVLALLGSTLTAQLHLTRRGAAVGGPSLLDLVLLITWWIAATAILIWFATVCLRWWRKGWDEIAADSWWRRTKRRQPFLACVRIAIIINTVIGFLALSLPLAAVLRRSHGQFPW